MSARIALACLALAVSAFAAEKPRVFVLTDIENEPDDAMSLVRYGTMHIMLAVTDRGTPPLTRYQRVIVTVTPLDL